jgi:3-deoxy-7-phosphoheptulonate synthase
VFQTAGNAYGHVVLRGGGGRPNFDAESIALCEAALQKGGLPARIMVDCSHANSNKDHNLQPAVAHDCVQQIVAGNRSIMGLMLESNLHAGNQPMQANRADLQYGVSVTDACIDWESTEKCLVESNELLKPVLASRA